MERKSDSKELDEFAAPPKNVVIRFCEYGYKVLNQDMDEFFEDNISAFDQDEDELRSGRGETFEQYDVYKRYLKKLEEFFDGFATSEGYDSVTSCFDDINTIIMEDTEERKKALKEMAERMKASFANWQQQFQKASLEADAKADSKGSSDEKSDVKRIVAHSDVKGETKEEKKGSKNDEDPESSAPPPPVLMFFQPISLDAMLQHMLTLTEYSTFS
jgi:hypothetical protein